MRLCITLFVGCCSLLALGGMNRVQAQAIDTIYTQQATGNIYNINSVTGASNLLASESGHYWNGAAFNPSNGLLYIDDIGTPNFTVGSTITNKIYSFDPKNPGAGVTLVGSVTGSAAFTGAGFHNGLYYTIATGSNQLTAYNLNGATGGTITATSTQTLGGLGSGVTGASLGDIDFKGNTIYITTGTVSGGTTVSSSYTLYSYTDVSNTTTPSLSVVESSIGVGIGYNPLTNTLIQMNSDNTISKLNPATGAVIGSSITITGPDTGGAGDYAIIAAVPEPRDYAALSLGLILALAGLHRFRQKRLQPGASC